MASLRQKDSKIPLRIDSNKQNKSRIPLRVETKQKILASTKVELERPSATDKKKTCTNPISRSKKCTKEILKKELKPVTLQSKNKMKENRLQYSNKKVSYTGMPKTTRVDKKSKNSNLVAPVLRDRNKISAKEDPEKHNYVKSKGDDSPYCVFEKIIPKVNITDDNPFKTNDEESPVKNSNHPSHSLRDRNKITTKEDTEKHNFVKSKGHDNPFKTNNKDKQIKNSNHLSQQNIEFVADERMKNFILSNRELTPSILKSCSSTKISSVMERPSLYNRSKFSCNAYQQALEDIANSDLASEERRISEMQKNGLYLSPSHNRNSLYKPMKYVGDPYQEALKSIAELRLHRKVKSCKKVTFKLSGEGKSSEAETRDQTSEEKIETNQSRLTDISEKSTGSTTHLTPECEGNILLTPSRNPTIMVHSPSNSNEVSEQVSDTCPPVKIEEQKTELFNNTRTILSSTIKVDENTERNVDGLSPISCQQQKHVNNAAIFSHDVKNSVLKTVNPFLDLLQRTSKIRHDTLSRHSEHFVDKMIPKIYTPQPVSLYPRINMLESISPEFLSKKTANILSCAPINTPFVLRSLGKQEESPVCKKLEFQDSPKETNKQRSDSRENTQTFYLQNFLTQQKIQDQLAHQECSMLMNEARFPCEIRKCLQNPIAQILENGDETHFVPVWRLSESYRDYDFTENFNF